MEPSTTGEQAIMQPEIGDAKCNRNGTISKYKRNSISMITRPFHG
jgi:hypothetical protein